MHIKKSICTSNREEIIHSVMPLYEIANSNKERFKNVLKGRNCEFNDEGYVKWSYSLLSANSRTITQEVDDKLEELDLIKKCEKFMDGIKDVSAVYCLEILELCDGFQLNLSAGKASDKKEGKDALLDSTSYFVWRAY